MFLAANLFIGVAFIHIQNCSCCVFCLNSLQIPNSQSTTKLGKDIECKVLNERLSTKSLDIHMLLSQEI